MSKNPTRPVDFDDLRKVFEDDERLEKQVFIKGDNLILNVKYEYVIELDRCNTPDKILAWVAHLTEKNWTSVEVLRRFIYLAAGHHGLKVQVPGT